LFVAFSECANLAIFYTSSGGLQNKKGGGGYIRRAEFFCLD